MWTIFQSGHVGALVCLKSFQIMYLDTIPNFRLIFLLFRLLLGAT